jgi:hypothetical protein
MRGLFAPLPATHRGGAHEALAKQVARAFATPVLTCRFARSCGLPVLAARELR